MNLKLTDNLKKKNEKNLQKNTYCNFNLFLRNGLTINKTVMSIL